MMQGQGGKRGPDQRPRTRKKETKAQKQRKAENKKRDAQAQSEAAKRGLLQLMLRGGSLPPMPAEGAEGTVAGASAASATNVAAGPAAVPAAASVPDAEVAHASEASAAAAAHDAPTTACVTCNAGCLQRCGCSSRHILCQPNSRVHRTHLVVAACACVHQTSRGRCGTLPHCTAAPVECRVYWTVLCGC